MIFGCCKSKGRVPEEGDTAEKKIANSEER